MPDTKTYILDDLPTDHDALDFTPYVEALMKVCETPDAVIPGGN